MPNHALMSNIYSTPVPPTTSLDHTRQHRRILALLSLSTLQIPLLAETNLPHYSLYGYQHMPYSLHHMHGAFQILLRRHIQDRAICLSLSHSVAFLLFLLRPYRSIISLSTLPALDLSGRVPTIQLIFFSDSFHSLDF